MGAPPAGAAAVDPRPVRGPRLRAQLRFAVVVISLVTAVSLWLGSGLAIPHVVLVAGPFPVIIALVATVLFASVGLIISVRRPEARMGRILAWAAIIQRLRDLSWASDAYASSGVVGLPLDPDKRVRLAMLRSRRRAHRGRRRTAERPATGD